MFINKFNVILCFQKLKNVDIVYIYLKLKIVFFFHFPFFMTPLCITPPFAHFWEVLPPLRNKAWGGNYDC